VKNSPVHFIVGAQALQQRLFVEEIRKALFPSGSGGLNDDTFDVKERNLTEIFDLANTFPMLAPKRLVVVRNVEDPKEADETRWLTYLENPSPHAVLIGIAAKLDKRKRLFKALEKAGVLVDLPEPKAKDLPFWIDQLSKHHGVTFSPRAKLILAEAVGTDLDLLEKEIEKLALFVHPETTIHEGAVTELVLETGAGNIFEFTDQVAERKTGEALVTMDHLMNSGTPPLVLLTMLARHLRILWKAHHHTKARTGRHELPAALGVPPFAVGRYVDQARGYQVSGLKKALAELARLDKDLKSSGLPAKFLMERSLRTITAPEPRG
jgi:DNA polymerase-3 subunit delta